MKRTIISILLFSGLAALIGTNEVFADEIYLCSSYENQYVVLTETQGGCIEGESEITLSDSSIKKSDDLAPVANFLENNECDGEGTKTEIGFDNNSNGELDQNEIVSTSSTCSPVVEPAEAPSQEENE